MCGEHPDPRRSAPRGRGIIPACAGNTRDPTVLTQSKRDHPRVCGEHLPLRVALVPVLGSSPRVRGTLSIWPSSMWRRGIIPACAGNTLSIRFSGSMFRDHPRVCGEHRYWNGTHVKEQGSSPRVRGTHEYPFLCRVLAGIIPACAGNTLFGCGVVCFCWDHPRVCGEHPPR